MSELLRLAERSGARIVFSGDTRQIQSVKAGDALRILETESRLKSTSLREVLRQKDRAYRKAIEELRRNPENGFRQLEEIGGVRQVPWDKRAGIVADAWEQANASSNGRKRSVLVVCATHDEIARVTEAAREMRKCSGELSDARQVPQDVALGWTVAQKGDWRNFRTGQVLVFHRAVKGIQRNSSVEVVRADAKGVVVRCPNGRERKLTGKQAQSCDVFERKAIEVACGEQLLFTANRRQEGFHATNGEIVTVDQIDADGHIFLRDGRVVPQDYTHLAHGYAITAHRSQGKSVDEVIVLADGMSRELFYVAASRGRERVTVVTSDADALRESVGRTAARQSATELARKALVRMDGGIRRGFAAACNMIRLARLWPVAALDRSISRITPRRERQAHGLSR
jgi:ATP-dependent exoDNAse (exonuclease V) alpha subunit